MDRFLGFLRTAIIDSLAVGSTADAVRQRLGPPHETSAIDPPIWKYQLTEIAFRDGYVTMITVLAHANAGAVTKMLDDAGITYRPHPELTYDDQTAYVIDESGVALSSTARNRSSAVSLLDRAPRSRPGAATCGLLRGTQRSSRNLVAWPNYFRRI